MNRYRLGGCSMVLLATWSPGRAVAAPVTTTTSKTIFWTFPAAPLATDLNVYEWNLVATASAGPLFKTVPSTGMSDPAKPATWAGNTALAPIDKSSGQAVSNGTTAQTTVNFSSTAPVAIAANMFQVTTNMVFTNVTDAGGNKQAATSISGSATMILKGGTAKSAIITQPGGKVVTAVALKGGIVSFGPAAKGAWADPITVSVTDVSTGAIAGSSVLGTDDGSYTGAGTFEWDSSGITLNAPMDGASSAGLDYTIGGPWVSNQSAGTVSLQNGVFLATGAFAGLPWMLDNPADPQMATLSPAYLPTLEMDYQVPSSILNATDNYQETLSLSGASSDSVPEPGSIVSLGIALIGLSRRVGRRRSMPN